LRIRTVARTRNDTPKNAARAGVTTEEKGSRCLGVEERGKTSKKWVKGRAQKSSALNTCCPNKKKTNALGLVLARKEDRLSETKTAPEGPERKTGGARKERYLRRGGQL